MIKANYDEDFTLTVAVLSEDDMATGLTVTYEIWTEDEATMIDSGTMAESSEVPGIYLYTTHVTQSEYTTHGSLYRAYFKTPSGYSDGGDDIMINDDLYKLVRENRHYNLSVENVLTIGSEITATNPRNLSTGVTNFVKTRIKAESQANWDSATPNLVYAWYQTVGDQIPYLMGKKGSGEPTYTGE